MTEFFSNPHRPIEIRLKKNEKILEVEFDDGAIFQLPAEYLRVESPSAEVQGHSADQKKLVAGCREVGIAELHPVGHYAIRIVFDDRHDTGIYSWQYLYKLGRDQEARWQDYLNALAEKSLSRDR